jgi:hypothetical protein
MNLATINHKLENFSTELDNIRKEGTTKVYFRDESQRIESRVEYLEEQIAILKESKDDLKWNKIFNQE